MTDAPQFTLSELEHCLVAACLADHEILEYTTVNYKSRLTGRLASLFAAAEVYYQHARGLLSRDALAQILANSEPDLDKHQDYLSLFDTLTSPPYSTYTAENRRWFLHQFDVEWKRDTFGNILAAAAEKMRSGHKAHGRDLTGADAGRQFLQEALVQYEATTRADAMSEAEFTSTTEQAKQDYITAQESPLIGSPFSLAEVNHYIGGCRPGAMHIWAGYAGEGKSFFMLNDAYESWSKGFNTAFASGEMSVPEIRARFVALHSWHLSVAGKIPHAIETIPLERGELTKEDHEIFLACLDDIKNSTSHGKFFAFKFPWRATPSMIFNKWAQYDEVIPLQTGVLDYLGLLASDQMRVSRREELDDLIRQTKQLAMTFRGGEGLALITGYQTNRQSYEQARQTGYYTLSCFAESSEAEKSANTAAYILGLPQNPDELKVGMLKNRQGELGEPIYVHRNLRHGHIASTRARAQAGVPTSPTVGSTGTGILDVI